MEKMLAIIAPLLICSAFVLLLGCAQKKESMSTAVTTGEYKGSVPGTSSMASEHGPETTETPAKAENRSKP
jgi:uncharacterized lipoprotein NlpE involved in copper resistance